MVTPETGLWNGHKAAFITSQNFRSFLGNCKPKPGDMQKRYVSIWFPHLATDWFAARQPQLKDTAFVLKAVSHGRSIVTAASPQAQAQGISTGMVLADARAILPSLQI